jgi:hypothetical protein
VKREHAIEEAGVSFASESGRTESKEKNKEEKKAETRDGHGRLQDTKCITDVGVAAKEALKAWCDKLSDREDDAGTS